MRGFSGKKPKFFGHFSKKDIAISEWVCYTVQGNYVKQIL